MTLNQILNTSGLSSHPFIITVFFIAFLLCLYLLLGGIKWSVALSQGGRFHLGLRFFFIPTSFNWDMDVIKKLASKKTTTASPQKLSRAGSPKKKKKNKTLFMVWLLGISLWNSRNFWYEILKIKKVGWSHFDVEIYGAGCALLAGMSGLPGIRGADLEFDFDPEKKKPLIQAEGLVYFGFFFLALFIFLTQLIRHKVNKFINFIL